jgi:hypothetical protein
MVETKTDSRTTLITVKNWALYQGDGEQIGEQTGDQKGEQKESRLPTDKNVRMEKWKRERGALSFPADEEEAKAFFREQNFMNPDVEGGKFFDYYGARGWAGVKDWRELAQVWNARTIEYAKCGNGQSTLEFRRASSKPLDDQGWKEHLIGCSACGQVHRAGESCREEVQKA